LFFILHLSPSKNGFPYINKVMWTLFFTGSFLALNALFRVSDTLAVVGVMGFSGLAFLNSIFGIRVWLKTRESFAFWFMLGWSMFGISMFAFMLFFSMGIGTKYLSNDIAHEVAQLLILIEGTTLSISLARWFLFQQSQKKQAEIASLTDPLTGLFNRRALDEELESRKLLMANEGAYTLAVVDIDHFKAINDNFGHATGDEVLKNVSFIIKSYIRGNDAAFRLGGEEFLLLLDNCNRSDAFLIIERVRQAFENKPTKVGSRTITHTLSAGLAQSKDQPFEQVLKEADDALYSSKRSGRNRVSFETGQSESSVAIC
jgi:diguanylate cyclase (GGDEF)-like protein